MDFLNKHYEKVILLTVLLIFFIGMIFVIGELNNTRNVSPDSLKIKKRSADQQVITEEEKAKDYNIAGDWKTGNFSWQAMGARKAELAGLCYSDLVKFTPVAECPFCLKLVPLTAFSEKPCPNVECKKLLRKPPARPKYRRNVITADDSDGDGMPDSYETKYGLDPKNPRDAQYDNDEDGFANCYEQMMGTDPSNGYSRPPLWQRLRLVKVDRAVLPFSFKKLNDNNSADSSQWDCQFNEITNRIRKGKRVMRTHAIRINEDLSIDGKTYRLVKIDKKIRMKTAAEIAKEKAEGKKGDEAADSRMIDESVAHFTEVLEAGAKYTPDKIEMEIGKPAYSSDRRPIFVDDGLLPELREKDEHMISLRKGQRFSLGDRKNTGVEQYLLYQFEDKKKAGFAVLHRARGKGDLTLDARGKEMKITYEGTIPDDSRIIPVEKAVVNTANSGTGENGEM